ncbi:MAG: apolipoprotein N-acyltransferase [Myxococcales bacterium]
MGRILLAAALTGTLGTLAFPEFSLWPLALVAYVPLFLVLRDRRPRDRFFAGWLAGFVLHAGVYTWIYDTARIMSSLPPWLAALVLLAFSLAHGLCQGFIALAVEPVRLHTGRAWPFAVAITAAVVEALFPHLFPWYLGNALYRTITLTQVADLIGIYGLSALCYGAAAALVDASVRRRDRGWRAALPPVAVLAGVMVAVAGYGAWRIASIRGSAPEATLRVALLQPFMTGEEKGDLKGMARQVLYDKSVNLLREVRGEPLDLVVLPEGGFPFYFVPNVERIAPAEGEPIKIHFGRRFMHEIRSSGVPVVFGSLMVGDDDRVRNAAVFVDRGPPLIYDKRRLVPFGEFMPLSDTFPSLRNAVKNVSDFVAGERHVPFVVAGRSLLPTICYEAIFPGFVRDAANVEPRADAILNLTNDVWFGRTAAPELHLMVQVTRAVEQRIPLIRSTNSGVSAFVDATGEITGRTGVYEMAILRGSVEIRSVWSFYRQFGDVFLWGSAAIVVLLMLYTMRARSFSGKSPAR